MWSNRNTVGLSCLSLLVHHVRPLIMLCESLCAGQTCDEGGDEDGGGGGGGENYEGGCHIL